MKFPKRRQNEALTKTEAKIPPAKRRQDSSSKTEAKFVHSNRGKTFLHQDEGRTSSLAFACHHVESPKQLESCRCCCGVSTSGLAT